VRFTFRAKLTLVVGVAAAAILIIIVASALLSGQVESKLEAIQLRQLPRLELGPRLERRLEALQRTLQDAVAAHDSDAIASADALQAQLLEELAAARGVVTPGEAAVLRGAMQDYYATASDVSRRLVAGETGEDLIESMKAMQGKQAKALDLLKATTSQDRTQLAESFKDTVRLERASGRARLAVGLGCLVLVILLSTWLSRGVLRSLSLLGSGLLRFGEG